MNRSQTVKTQNMHSFTLLSQDGFDKNKVKAATLECDNMQEGDKSRMLTKAFNHEGYKLLNNSTQNNMKGVSIAL